MNDKMLQRTSAVSLVLNDNGANLLRSSKYLMGKLIKAFEPKFIAVIKHDKDVDKEINQLKTEHYHVVMVCYQCMILKSYLEFIVDGLHVNENQVSIQKCNDVVMSTQYLIHQNDRDKVQYNFLDIDTNDFDTLTDYLKKIPKINTTKEAIAIYDNFFGNIREIMGNLSIKCYKEWRIFFNDLERYDSKKWR